MLNPNTKFEVSSFCYSRDGGLKNLNGSSYPKQRPFWGIGRLGLAIANLYTQFEISVYTRYEGMKSGAKSRIWSGLGS